MTRTIQIGLLAGILALATMAPALAQMAPPLAPGYTQFGFGPLGNQAYWNYTGVLTPYGYIPPRSPVVWTAPNYNYVYQNQPPQVIYVPVEVPMAAARPAVAPAQVTTITLRPGVRPAEVRVKPGTVVVWRNSGKEEVTLIFPQLGQRETGGQEASQRWPIRPGSSFSLAFNQPAVYDYYEAQDPGYRAHVIVTQ